MEATKWRGERGQDPCIGSESMQDMYCRSSSNDSGGGCRDLGYACPTGGVRVVRTALLALFMPRRFVWHLLSRECPHLEEALLPLAATSGLLLFAMYRLGDKLIVNLSGLDRLFFSITYFLTAFGTAMSVVIVWLSVTGASHLLSLEFGGAPVPFRRFAVATAWSTMPIGLYALIIIVSSTVIDPMALDSIPAGIPTTLKYGRYAADGWSGLLVVMVASRMYKNSFLKTSLIVATPVAIQLLTVMLLSNSVLAVR